MQSWDPVPGSLQRTIIRRQNCTKMYSTNCSIKHCANVHVQIMRIWHLDHLGIVMYCDVLWCTQNYKKAWRWRENSRQATGGYQSRRQFQGFQWSKAQGLRKFMCYDNSMTVLWCTMNIDSTCCKAWTYSDTFFFFIFATLLSKRKNSSAGRLVNRKGLQQICAQPCLIVRVPYDEV